MHATAAVQERHGGPRRPDAACDGFKDMPTGSHMTARSMTRMEGKRPVLDEKCLLARMTASAMERTGQRAPNHCLPRLEMVTERGLVCALVDRWRG
jgi:hypothetical protein